MEKGIHVYSLQKFTGGSMRYSPHWDLTTIPDAPLYAEAARRRSAKRGEKVGGRPTKPKTCPFCAGSFGSRALRAHLPLCLSRPARRASTKTVAPPRSRKDAGSARSLVLR